jgi:hypothetical protein
MRPRGCKIRWLPWAGPESARWRKVPGETDGESRCAPGACSERAVRYAGNRRPDAAAPIRVGVGGARGDRTLRRNHHEGTLLLRRRALTARDGPRHDARADLRLRRPESADHWRRTTTRRPRTPVTRRRRSELTLNASGELCATEEYWCEGAGGDFNITQCIYPTCQFSCYFHAGNVHYDTCEMEWGAKGDGLHF